MLKFYYLQNVYEARVEPCGVRLHLDAPPAKSAPVRPDVEELRAGLPVGHLARPPAALLDDETLLEVGHELEVLLLLLHADHFKLLAKKGLELLLEAECEREPAHVAGIATLKKRKILFLMQLILSSCTEDLTLRFTIIIIFEIQSWLFPFVLPQCPLPHH